jgi:hypothetical protein
MMRHDELDLGIFEQECGLIIPSKGVMRPSAAIVATAAAAAI